MGGSAHYFVLIIVYRMIFFSLPPGRLTPPYWINMGAGAISTWWLPILVRLRIWRHEFRRYPMSYDVQLWSMVVPLGIYAACTYQLGDTAGLALLLAISHYFTYLALLAWIMCFSG